MNNFGKINTMNHASSIAEGNPSHGAGLCCGIPLEFTCRPTSERGVEIMIRILNL
jgi:hypothetical protein